jgi:hypothetical protein
LTNFSAFSNLGAARLQNREMQKGGKRRRILVAVEWVSSFQELNLANFKKRR